MSNTKEIEFEESSGNVFSDLELQGAEELQARGLIGFHVVQLLQAKNMKQRELSELLGIKQSEISHLLNGHFSRFTIDKLFDFLNKLDQKIVINISPHKRGEPFHEVAFSG